MRNRTRLFQDARNKNIYFWEITSNPRVFEFTKRKRSRIHRKIIEKNIDFYWTEIEIEKTFIDLET